MNEINLVNKTYIFFIKSSIKTTQLEFTKKRKQDFFREKFLQYGYANLQ